MKEPKFRIKEYRNGKFKVYRKGWIFWNCLREFDGWADDDAIFASLSDAESRVRRELYWIKAQKNKKIVTNIRDYPPNKV